ncbi:MAG: flagellar basal body P-ring protein FlgI [Phycisphaerae bacterium]
MRLGLAEIRLMVRRILLAVVMVAAALAGSAEAVRIGDITRLKGRRQNKLVGLGLVVGLKGSGDGGRYMPAMRPLASLLKRFNDPAFSVAELENAKNVAIVHVEATLPDNGVREGDRVDVQVSSIGAAKSLLGGRLVLTPLQGPSPQAAEVMALASGPVVVPDTRVPTTGLVHQGATMERSVLHSYVVRADELEQPHPPLPADGHYITLVIDDAHASWAMAATIAMSINDRFASPGRSEPLAVAADPKNVIVRVPPEELQDVAGFIGSIESHDLIAEDVMEATEARVKINRTTGTIVITGEVEISPAVITHKGLTIRTVSPPVQPTAMNPMIEQQQWVALNPGRIGTAKQTQKLADLVQALNQLKVPVEDRIAIIEELHKTGKLHAKLIVEH